MDERQAPYLLRLGLTRSSASSFFNKLLRGGLWVAVLWGLPGGLIQAKSLQSTFLTDALHSCTSLSMSMMMPR